LVLIFRQIEVRTSLQFAFQNYYVRIYENQVNINSDLNAYVIDKIDCRNYVNILNKIS